LQPLSLEPLQPVPQHWTVDLPKDIGADLDYVVRSNAQNVCIECRVMETAQCKSVRDPCAV